MGELSDDSSQEWKGREQQLAGGKGKRKDKEVELLPKKRFFPLRLSLTFQLIFDLLSTILAITAFFLWTSPTYQYSDLVTNWSSAPISNIELVPLNGNCSEGHRPLNAFYFGSDYVCDCGANDILLSACRPGYETCSNIQATEAFDLPNWRNFKICVAYHPSGDIVSGYKRSCEHEGWKKCSDSAHPVCVPEDTVCPLTSFDIVGGGPNLCPKDTEAIPAFPGTADPRHICLSRKGDSPLVEISNSLGGRCLAPQLFNPYSKMNPRKGESPNSIDLAAPPFACGGSQYDRRFKDVDVRQMGQLFSDNKGSFADVSDRTTHSYWLNNPYPVFYKLQTRSEIEFSHDCPVSKKSLVDAEDHLVIITKAQTGLVVVNLVGDVLINIPWIIWSCTAGYKSYYQRTPALLAKSILVITMNVITVSLIGATFYMTYGLRSLFNTTARAKCSDEQSQDLFNSYSNELIRTMAMDCAVFAWGIVLIIMELRLMCVLPNKPSSKSNKQGKIRNIAHSKSSELEIRASRSDRPNFHGSSSVQTFDKYREEEPPKTLPPSRFDEPEAHNPY